MSEPWEQMPEEQKEVLIKLGQFLRDALIAANLPPYDAEEVLQMKSGLLAGIPIYQSVSVPVDSIVIHPFVFSRILNNATPEDGYIDIIKKRINGENT